MIGLGLLRVTLVQVPGVSTHTEQEFIEEDQLRPGVVAKAVWGERGNQGWTLICLIGMKPWAVSQFHSAKRVIWIPSSQTMGWVRGVAEERGDPPGHWPEPDLPVRIRGLGDGHKKRICDTVMCAMPGCLSRRAVHQHMRYSFIISVTQGAGSREETPPFLLQLTTAAAGYELPRIWSNVSTSG
eukprot:1182818-Rhodomonas_salina.1